MKTLIIALAAVVSLVVSGLALAQNMTATVNNRGVTNTPSSALIKIEHDWDCQKGNVVTRMQGDSLGTAIGPNIILTHNHFAGALGTLPNEVMTFTDTNGKAITIPVADLVLVPVDKGTMLIYLPTDVALNSAPAGDPSSVGQLTNGDWLAVDYWDDTANRFAQQNFQIIQVVDGIATVADPQRLINPGDSGGGVYFDGKVIGNNWSMNAKDGKSVGTFNVALLPTSVMDLMQPATTGAANEGLPTTATVEEGLAK
jgi:hypothetical protein